MNESGETNTPVENAVSAEQTAAVQVANEMIALFRTALEKNIDNKLSIELGTGMLSTVTEKANDLLRKKYGNS